MSLSVVLSAGGVEPGTAAQFDFSRAFSIQWWLQHLSDAYAENPLHMLTELLLVILILYLVFARQKTIQPRSKLSAKEEQQLIEEWEPEPLASFSNPSVPSSWGSFNSSFNASNGSFPFSNVSNSPQFSSAALPPNIYSHHGSPFYSNLYNSHNLHNIHTPDSTGTNSKSSTPSSASNTFNNNSNFHSNNQLLIKSAMGPIVRAVESFQFSSESAANAVNSDELDNNVKNGDEVGTRSFVQFASHNYLGFANLERIKQKCVETIKKYAVGSCGPRGFYGTMDIHLNLEKKLSDFFSSNTGSSSNTSNMSGDGSRRNNREAIIYADNIGCCASVITAFAKRGDLLLIDEGCHYLVTQGAMLSRANVIWYPHNDMKQLESYLQTVQEQDERLNRPLNRRYIVTEGLFHNHGDICDLKQICALKNEYKYRLILDDSHGLGTLHPKGSPGYWGIDMSKIDIYLSSMDTALGSTGGFCVGDYETIYHQTLSGAGYVFSASAPPFQCTAVIEALNILESDQGEVLVREVQDKAQLMRAALEDAHGRWTLTGEPFSPLIHLRLTNSFVYNNYLSAPVASVQNALQQGAGKQLKERKKSGAGGINSGSSSSSSSSSSAADRRDGRRRGRGRKKSDGEGQNVDANIYALFEKVCYLARTESDVIVFASAYLPQEFGIPEKCDPKPSLRIVVTREHTAEQIKHAATVIKDLLSKLLNDGRIEARK